MILSMNHTGPSSLNIKYNAYDYENKIFIWNIKYIKHCRLTYA